MKRRRGTLRPCREKDREPEPRDFDRWTPPEWLSPGAREKYQALALELSSIGVLKSTDTDVLALYCQTYSDVQALTELVREHGWSDGKRSSPYATQLRAALGQMILLGRELGLSPSSRSRVVVEKSEGKGDGLLC